MRVLTQQYALDDRLAADYIEQLAHAMGRDFNEEIAKTSLGIFAAWDIKGGTYYMNDDSHGVGFVSKEAQ